MVLSYEATLLWAYCSLTQTALTNKLLQMFVQLARYVSDAPKI